jgi:hypothetical protein
MGLRLMEGIKESTYPEVDFMEHMKEKALLWGAYQVDIAKNFAVFEFDTPEQRDTVRKTLIHYEKCYGYTSHVGDRERFAIVKGDKVVI